MGGNRRQAFAISASRNVYARLKAGFAGRGNEDLFLMARGFLTGGQEL
jgi:hypothetical protein